MFREHPFLDRFAAAAAAGFEGVEIQNLAEGDPYLMAQAASDAGVAVALVNVGLGDLMTGGPGLSGVPGREGLFREQAAIALDAARMLGARRVHIGPSRIPAGASRAECLAAYRQNVAVMLRMMEGEVDPPHLLVEAMNRVEMPDALFCDAADAATITRTDFDGRLGLLFDIYHTAMNGRDVLSAYATCRDVVSHIQFADAPGRHEPGSGAIDLASILKGLRESGYNGWLGAEYRPRGATADSLGWLTPARTSLESD